MRPKSFGTFEKQVPQFPLYLRNGSKLSNFSVLLVSLRLKHVKRSAFQTKRDAFWQPDFGPESSLYFRETWWQREPQQQIFHCLPVPSGENREFKKVRRQQQRKRHVKIELCVNLSLLRLLHVDHVVQNGQTALSLAWYEWFSCKGKKWKIYCCELALSSEPQIWKFHAVVWQTTSKFAPKSVPHVQHDYFSSFNQSNHWFVSLALPLPSSFLKLPNMGLLRRHKFAYSLTANSLSDKG